MRKKGTGRRITYREKADSLLIAGLIAYILGLLFRVPLLSVIGNNGMGYFASVNEIFGLFALFITYGMAAALDSMIRLKIKREQYKNAQRFLRYSVLITLIFGVLICSLLLIFNRFVAETVLLEGFSRMVLCIMAPALLFSALTALLRGYFQGTGSRMPSVHSLILEKVLTFVLGMFFAVILYDYGQKVAELLQNKNYAAAYGAVGAALGVLAASVISLLHLLFIYLLYNRTLKKQLFKDGTRTMDSKGDICRSILWSAIPYGAFAILYSINTLADQRIYYYFMNHVEQGIKSAENWGIYYGVYLVVIGILTALCCMTPARAVRSITGAWAKDEYRAARDRMTGAICSCMVITIPTAIFIFILAKPVTAVLQKGDNTVAAGLIQSGSSLIVLLVFAYLWVGLLKQFQKIGQLLLIGLGAFAVHVPVTYILIDKTGMGINAIALGNVLSGAVIVIAGYISLTRILQYHREGMLKCLRTMIITIITAGVSGLIVMLLNKAILPLAGEIITILISVFIGVAVYMILMILLRGIQKNDLMKSPVGIIILRLAKRLHLL